MLKSLWNSLSFQQKCLLHEKENQVDSGGSAPAGANLEVQLAENCNNCGEESNLCKCDHHINVKSVAAGGTNLAEEHDHEANSSLAHTVINMVGTLIGLGQLSTPYAVEQGGWGASAIFLIGLGVICTYTSHLLGKCLKKNPKLRGYVDIGYHAFGAKGRFIVATFIYMETFMSLVSYTISLHDNLMTVLHLKLHLAKLSSPQLLTIGAVLIVLPSLWLRDLSSISFLSILAVLMTLVIFVSVAATGIVGDVRVNHKISFLHLHNIPSISGLYIFSYAGHIVFPNLHKAMKDPSKFTKASIVSFTLVTTLYTILGYMGAKMFGPEVNSQVTLSMPPKQIVTKIALWATVLTPMSKYALAFAPCAIQLEHRLPNSMSGRTKMIVRGLIGSSLLLVILALALTVPYFEHALSLTGSVVSVAICLIFPCAFYMKIFWGHITKPLLILNMSIITLGFLLGVMGTISTTKSLVKIFLAS
ncbi:amino acid transporter AVT1H-like [Lotus japonicus]|uniref:amino acid transporter AVT1H-like n=1 Tax=Lotus japonicus TaxID=34305 RepID=UPI002583F5DD|nr:amino acid transporter AVT1H-like [Lotus japonicus]